MERRRAIRINTGSGALSREHLQRRTNNSGGNRPGAYIQDMHDWMAGMCPPCLRITAAFALFRAPEKGRGLTRERGHEAPCGGERLLRTSPKRRARACVG